MIQACSSAWAAQEYGPRIYEDTEGFAGYLTTGTTPSVASGRVAYTLGLAGPGGDGRHRLLVISGCGASRRAIVAVG